MSGTYNHMNLNGIMPFMDGIFLLILGISVLRKNFKSKAHVSWFLLAFVTSIWTIFYSFAYFINKDSPTVLLLFKIGYVGVIFIPIIWTQFIIYFLDLNKFKKIIPLLYLPGVVFALLLCTKDYFVVGLYRYYWGYYPKVNFFIHPLFLLFYSTLWSSSLVLLYLRMRKEKSPLFRQRIKYVFLSLSAVFPGLVDFLGNYGIGFYPLGGAILVTICLTILSYGIYKYRLMDIRIFISRAFAFLISYSLLLVVPFFFAYRMYPVLHPLLGINWWLAPVSLLIFFATIAPIAYDQIRRGMEEKLLAEQKRYQKLLLQAASGMVREHSLGHLSKLIVHIVKRAVKIDFAAIFLEDKDKKVYKLSAIRDSGISSPSIGFSYEHPFIGYLRSNPEPVLYEELPQAVRNSLSGNLNISLFIPSSIENNLLGFLVLGEKISREPYSEDDINVFKILSHQAAMAIENCLFFEEFKSVQQKIFTAEKLASIGGMADGVAHQIKNRLNHFSIASGEMQCEISDFIEKHPQVIEQNPDLKKSFDYLNHIADSMIDNVKRTDAVVKGILGYARVEEKGTFFSKFPFSEILEMSLELIRIKHEVTELPLACELGPDDNLYGVKAQLMECLFNLLDNHYEAVVEKRNKLSDEEKLHFTPLIKLKLAQYTYSSRIEVSDNGIGIKEEDKFKIFAPFFTTKSSYKSGSGIGMYVVKRIIEENHKGKIRFESTYMQGTKFIIDLPKK